ncbi:MAG: hypothetical protein WBS20_13350 [Lysobacterales bacterium]
MTQASVFPNPEQTPIPWFIFLTGHSLAPLVKHNGFLALGTKGVKNQELRAIYQKKTPRSSEKALSPEKSVSLG